MNTQLYSAKLVFETSKRCVCSHPLSRLHIPLSSQLPGGNGDTPLMLTCLGKAVSTSLSKMKVCFVLAASQVISQSLFPLILCKQVNRF